MTLNALKKVMLANKYNITIDTGCDYVTIHVDYIDRSIEQHREALKLLQEWGKAKVKYIGTYDGVIDITAEM